LSETDFRLGAANRSAAGQRQRICRSAETVDRRTNIRVAGRYRRHSKDYEKTSASSENITYIAMINLMSQRLANAEN
jgi:hypothetical protein